MLETVMQQHGGATWLGWVGAAVVAALVTAAAVWSGWQLRRLWPQARNAAGRWPRHRSQRRTGGPGLRRPAMPANTRVDPLTAAAGRAAYGEPAPAERVHPGVPQPSRRESIPAPETASVRTDPGEATALLEELLDRLHAVAGALDELAARRRRRPDAPVAETDWELEFVNTTD